MKFDAVIMNPPYNRNLHLQVLEKVVSTFPEAEIINLSPIRWLQDPLAEYKKNSDFNKYNNIRQNIVDIKEIPANEATDYFSAGITMNLGVYYIKTIENTMEKYK